MKNNPERIKAGFRVFCGKKTLFLIPALYLCGIFVMENEIEKWLSELPMPYSSIIFRYILIAFVIEIAVLGVLGIFALAANPPESRIIERKLASISLVNQKGNPPILLSLKRRGKKREMELFSEEITLDEYKKHSNEIETVLNLRIAEILAGRDKQHIIIVATSGLNQKAGIIKWDNSFLSKKDFELVLGESEFGTESVDISVMPHLLIGGGSGSGKTMLEKLILLESLEKGAKVIIADFKGGVDYPEVWHERCLIITDAQRFAEQLTEILLIMEERRQLLREAQTPNITNYWEKTGKEIQRIIVAIDEVAEVFDKTGLEKNEKAIISQIEAKVSTIARQGRAFGIHLVLSTQRPDADVLKGQIKVNVPFRVCGRADKVLSQIVLDSPDAAERIMPTDQGVFLTNSGVLFRAYYADDSVLSEIAALPAKEGQTP